MGLNIVLWTSPYLAWISTRHFRLNSLSSMLQILILIANYIEILTKHTSSDATIVLYIYIYTKIYTPPLWHKKVIKANKQKSQIISLTGYRSASSPQIPKTYAILNIYLEKLFPFPHVSTNTFSFMFFFILGEHFRDHNTLSKMHNFNLLQSRPVLQLSSM